MGACPDRCGKPPGSAELAVTVTPAFPVGQNGFDIDGHHLCCGRAATRPPWLDAGRGSDAVSCLAAVLAGGSDCPDRCFAMALPPSRQTARSAAWSSGGLWMTSPIARWVTASSC